MSEPLQLLFVIDPIDKLSIDKDTSLAFMEAAGRRGHRVFACQVRDLYAVGSDARALAREVTVARAPRPPHHIWVNDTRDLPLTTFAAVFMRKDPPFNMDYIFATYILSLAAQAGVRVVNDPRGLRDCNEKAYILNFPDLIPPTVVTRRASVLRDFMAEHGDSVIKPLDGKGGEGILLLRKGDLNINSIIELLTAYEQRFVIVQRFVPEARSGDKRIILVDGQPLGAFLRVPASDDLRGNMSAGATVQAAELTERDREICAALAPRLAADGHVFVGIDILGSYLTEINVTSPTGVREIKKLGGLDIADHMIAWLER